MATFRDAGVVDQDVDRAHLVQCRRRQPVDRLKVGQVGHPHARLGGVDPAPGEHLGEPRLPTGADAHHRAAPGEILGQSGTDARRRPGHQDPLPRKLQCHLCDPPLATTAGPVGGRPPVRAT